MKFSYNWLKQYVDFPWSPQELAEKLTFAGIEVENVVSVGGNIPAQVVVCQILASEKHPNADKLSVCRVNDGTGERQIVCGAKNYQVGDKVPLALPGVTLSNGLTIKPAKLRGVESHGMMCSAKELGLAEDAEGLLILPAELTVGVKLREALGGGDTVFDIEVTPNRPDWLSVIGVAREVAALTGNPLKLPELSHTETAESAETLASVTVDAPDLCPRYTAQVIRGVKIGPSPAWLKQILEKVGLRAINNVVDVTNYVLLETGHPLHAFDYHLVKGHQIIVRRAARGEQFVAIDDSRHELTNAMLVIADAERAVALAGIMGGKNSEIHDATTDVLLEAAYFSPPNIRRTSKQLGLVSESSYRFERGTDIVGLVWASQRAAALIQQVAGGQVARGMIDVLAQPIAKRRVRCRYTQVNRLLGIDVPPATVAKIFSGLGLQPVAAVGDRGHNEAVEVEIPTFRVDLEREADLIEEVCRIHGVEKIPARRQPSVAQVSEFDGQWDRIRRVRQTLTALGFHEAQNQTMMAEGELKLQNPLSSDLTALRDSLVPGLLQNLRTNVSRHQFDLKLFEIGRVFGADGKESLQLAIAVTGKRRPQSWEAESRDAKLDFHDLKGTLEELSQCLLGAGRGGTRPSNSGGTAATPSASSGSTGTGSELVFDTVGQPELATGVLAEVSLSGQRLGVLKEISTAKCKRLDLRDAVFVAELDLEPLLTAAPQAERQYRDLPKFPAVVRDVALVVREELRHGDVLAAIGQHRNKLLERIELFDIFRGGPIPTGKKSLAYSLTYRAERNLTDAEVNEAHEQLKRQLQQTLQCEIRES